jgi:hypothetical protein
MDRIEVVGKNGYSTVDSPDAVLMKFVDGLVVLGILKGPTLISPAPNKITYRYEKG